MMEPHRIEPFEPPFTPDVEDVLRRMMPATSALPPLALFRTLARHRPLSDAMVGLGSYILGKKPDREKALPSRIREIAILRVTARCDCEYEWGVHAVVFGARVGLTEAQIEATSAGDRSSACWSREDAAVIACVDALHDSSRVPGDLWAECARFLGAEQMLELLVVTGWYQAISYVANGAAVQREPWAARFPAR